MSSKIVVTGLGIISAIGRSPAETFDALINKRSGIGPITVLDTIHRGKLPAGEIKLTHEELIALAGVHESEPWTRTALLALIAAKQACNDAGLNDINEHKTGLISATTVGGMDRSELLYKEFLEKDVFNPFIDTHHAGNSTENIARQLNIKEFITTVSTACSSSLNSIMLGARLIKNGMLDRVVVGGTDALSKFTINGFNTLMILDTELCRPFDETRVGLNLGEGAAYLVLEREDVALKKGKKIYAEVSGYANANDAFHQTASSDEGIGPYLAMKNALEVANLQASDIDYINVHGTGTENNDLTEGRAMQRLFDGSVPEFSSTKAYTGHTLGAAGAIESIISILALDNDTIFPNLNFKNKIQDLDIAPEEEIKSKPIEHVLANSFGFGGNDSSVIFSKSRPSSANLSTVAEKHSTPVYINGIGAVAPVETLNPESFLEELPTITENYLQIVKPNYRDYIEPKLIRRMSKIVRMGIVAAKTAMKDAGIETTDAIITGTGMGCQADTEKFLNAMIENDETMLNPTAFIQSTHNTVGGQIALLSGNHNYNLAYVHRTFSFESALIDGLLYLSENDDKNILVGGIDEITEESWKIKTHIDFFKRDVAEKFDLLKDEQKGALAGESAGFFVLSRNKTENTYAAVKAVKTFFQPQSSDETEDQIKLFLQNNSLKAEDIDLVLMGYNGDKAFDGIYDQVANELFSRSNVAYFKHLCGEHDSASAFATWLASTIVKNGVVPEIIKKENRNNLPPKTVLVYNQFRNINHSLILLEKV